MRLASVRCRAWLAATLCVSLGGCFGAGGGDGDGAPVASLSTKNSFYVKVPNLSDAVISEFSPDGGQTTTLGAKGSTTFRDNVYETRSASVAGTPVALTGSGTLVCYSCEPTDPDKFYEGFTITQGSKKFTYQDDPDDLKDGAATVNQRFLSVRTTTGEGADLESAYYGDYLSVTHSATVVTELDEGTEEEEREIRLGEGSAVVGHYFGGTATGADDMTTLKNSSTTATYLGTFYGFGATDGADLSGGREGADLAGRVSLTANFGSATVSGSVYDMQRSSGDCEGCEAGFGIALNGDITGSSYAGTAKFTEQAYEPGAQPLEGSSTGQVIGGFYGAGASETAGAVRVVGDMPGGEQGFVGGSFGAVKTEPAP
jgi:hypothetical protein